MEETEKTEENKQETEKQTEQTEVKPLTLEEAREERKKLEEIHVKIKTENDRTEKLMASAMLEGRGIINPKKKEENKRDYSERVMKGEI